MNHLHRGSIAALTFISIGLAAPVNAGSADIIASRIAAYRGVGVTFKNVNDELRTGTPNSYVLQYSARKIGQFANQQYELFPKGTGPEAGKTRALPSIWRNPAAFKKAQDDFSQKALAFVAATKSGNLDRIRGAARELGRTCSACHRDFREDD